jgi:hypothetical protein
MENFDSVQPIRSNKFIMNVVGTDIPSHLFKNYRMYNHGKTMIIETEFYETQEWVFNPQEFFDIEDLLIQYLNDEDEVIFTLDFSVVEIFYEKTGSYHDNDYVTNKLKFITDNCEVIMVNKQDKEEVIQPRDSFEFLKNDEDDYQI